MIKMPFLPLKHKYPKMGKNTIKIKKNIEKQGDGEKYSKNQNNKGNTRNSNKNENFTIKHKKKKVRTHFYHILA